jgi:RecA/RadA recombinase
MTKKPAKKKTTPKKAPKKAPKAKAAKAEKKSTAVKELPVIGLMDNTNLLSDIATLANTVLSGRKNRTTGFCAMSDIREEYYPLPFYLQSFFGCIGIHRQTWMNIIGGTGVGKTTFGMTLMSYLIQKTNGFGLHIDTENKSHTVLQRWRHISTNPIIAEQIHRQRLAFKHAYTLDEMVETIEEFLKAARGVTVRGGKSVFLNMRQPIFIFVDPLSKLMTPAEAVDVYAYKNYMNMAGRDSEKEEAEAAGKKGKKGKDKKKEATKKEIGTGSNLGFAKFQHEFMRKVPAMCAQYNATFICSHQQNDKIDMAGGGMSAFIPEEYKALFNDVCIGGNAADQNAAYIVILSRGSDIKDSNGGIIGHRNRMRLHKNSFGPGDTIRSYEVFTQYPMDRADYLSPAMYMDREMLFWLAKDKLIPDLKYDNGLWHCPSLNMYGQSVEAVVEALKSESCQYFPAIGRLLKIDGYYDVVREVKKAVANDPKLLQLPAGVTPQIVVEQEEEAEENNSQEETPDAIE